MNLDQFTKTPTHQVTNYPRGPLGTGDIGMRGGDDDIDARTADVQRIDRHGSRVAARRARLLVDDDADAARQRNGEVRIEGEDRLSRDDQANELRIAGDGGLAAAAAGARVRLHDIGSNQTTQ